MNSQLIMFISAALIALPLLLVCLVGVVVAMNILMLLLGCILETVSIILLTMPLVVPIMHALGIDPIWYAIVLTVNMEIALVTPPVGMNLYVISGLDKDIRMADAIRGILPFIAILFLFLLLMNFL